VRQVGLYAALWLISVVGVYGVGVMQKIFALSSVNRQLALVEKDAKQVQGVLKRTNFLRDELEAGDIPLDILKALHEAIPGDTYLLALNYDRQGILVQGTTGALGSVTDFMDRLEKTKVFSKVQLKTYSVRNVQGKQWVDFYIQSQPRIEMHSNEKVS
jgi:Tfp pilus assembly protein PilN